MKREWIRLRKATRLSSPKSYGATGSEQQTNPPSPSLRRDRPQMDADEELGIAAKGDKKRKKRGQKEIPRKDKRRIKREGTRLRKATRGFSTKISDSIDRQQSIGEH